MNSIIINFPEQCFTMERDGKMSRHHFAYDSNVRSIGTGDLSPADNSTKTDIESMQLAANSVTDRATADYPIYSLRNRAISEVDVVSRRESKDNNKGCPFGKRARGDNDNCVICDLEQVTRCRLNECCSSHATNDDHKSDSRGEEVMNNYDVCTASRLGCYEERNVGDTEPTTDTHNTNTDDRAINKDQICELINELENLTSDRRQILAVVLVKHQGNFTKKPGKCRGFEYTFHVQG